MRQYERYNEETSQIEPPLNPNPAPAEDPERWVIVKQVALDVGFGDDVRTGGRPELGYALLSGSRLYDTKDEAREALRAAKLPLGWVLMPLSQLLPELGERK